MTWLTLEQVEKMVGFKKSWIYSNAAFPKPVKVGARNRWLQSEVEAYMKRFTDTRPQPK